VALSFVAYLTGVLSVKVFDFPIKLLFNWAFSLLRRISSSRRWSRGIRVLLLMGDRKLFASSHETHEAFHGEVIDTIENLLSRDMDFRKKFLDRVTVSEVDGYISSLTEKGLSYRFWHGGGLRETLTLPKQDCGTRRCLRNCVEKGSNSPISSLLQHACSLTRTSGLTSM
jgi:hypothetical protein